MAQEYDYVFKLVLIGDSGVGKSCLLLRFAVRAPGLGGQKYHVLQRAGCRERAELLPIAARR